MEQEDGNHGNGDNGNEETSKTEREESIERETGEGEKMEGEGETEKEEPAAAMETEQDLFTLSAVNAYGSQEVRKIEDEPDKVYTLTSKSTAPLYTCISSYHRPLKWLTVVHVTCVCVCVCVFD